MNNDLKVPKTTQCSLGLRQLFGEYSGAVTYAAQRGVDQFTWNVAAGGLNNDGITCCNFPFNCGAHGIASVIYSSNDVKTWYDALSFQLDKAIAASTRTHLDGVRLTYTFATRWLEGEDNLGDTFAFPQATTIKKHAAPNNENTCIVGNWIPTCRAMGNPVVGAVDLGVSTRWMQVASGSATISERGGFTVPGTFPYQTVDMLAEGHSASEDPTRCLVSLSTSSTRLITSTLRTTTQLNGQRTA
jgi:hypothetical protein